MNPRPLAHRLLALERHPLGSLAWRVLLVLIAFRPWAWRFEPADVPIEKLPKELLDAVKAVSPALLDPANWATPAGVIAKVMGTALAFALAWWLLSRLRRLVARRFGAGLWSTLVPVLGCGLIAFGIHHADALLRSPEFYGDGYPVWSGWICHPRFGHGGFDALLLELNLVGLLLGEAALQAAEGRLLLREARDGALRARLTPHFLYNAFNTLAAQIRQDPPGAEDTTQRLSALFEQVAGAVESPTVPLRQELAFVEDCLAIERRRLGERLRVTVEVPDDLLELPVPVLGLQVLVENALKHALAPRPEGGTLAIRAWREGQAAWIAVTDSGDGTSRAEQSTGTGRGRTLENLRARLARARDLVLEATPQGFQARFRVVIP